mmetsp:Transcript_11308/g.25714  ORF Transcript_11308/g.25714 Transcript_11308/m.25714 type:complete len:272 (+) Transcript_11308:4642-5457(+)
MDRSTLPCLSAQAACPLCKLPVAIGLPLLLDVEQWLLRLPLAALRLLLLSALARLPPIPVPLLLPNRETRPTLRPLAPPRPTRPTPVATTPLPTPPSRLPTLPPPGPSRPRQGGGKAMPLPRSSRPARVSSAAAGQARGGPTPGPAAVSSPRPPSSPRWMRSTRPRPRSRTPHHSTTPTRSSCSRSRRHPWREIPARTCPLFLPPRPRLPRDLSTDPTPTTHRYPRTRCTRPVGRPVLPAPAAPTRLSQMLIRRIATGLLFFLKTRARKCV